MTMVVAAGFDGRRACVIPKPQVTMRISSGSRRRMAGIGPMMVGIGSTGCPDGNGMMAKIFGTGLGHGAGFGTWVSSPVCWGRTSLTLGHP